jgi:asparagine synthase (glutamine-hydrolysing)
MRGFFGVFGPDEQVRAIVARYEDFKSRLHDTLFSAVEGVGSGEWEVEVSGERGAGSSVGNRNQDNESSQNVNKMNTPGIHSSQNVNYMSQWIHTGKHVDPEPRQLFNEFKVIGWASLYEKADLKLKLGISGDFTSLELIQHAWSHWGHDCVKYLEGDFSFAVWDDRTKKLFLAKDQLGIRPLFYALVDGCLVYGTTIPAIKCAFATGAEINRMYVAHELKNYPPTVEMTAFRDIHRLKPAHLAHIDRPDQFFETRYWDLEPIKIEGIKTDDEYIEMVRDEMIKAILRRINGIEMVGCQLSGGLDSSVIGVVLSKLMDKHKLHTYSFVLSEKTIPYSERGIDEQWSQDLVREFAGLLPENHHHITEFHYKDVFDELDTNIRVMGGLANSDTIWQDTLFKHASEHGVRVSFSGFPGDEGISTPGGNYYYDYFKNFALVGLMDHIRHYHVKTIKHLAAYLRYKQLGTTKPTYPAIQKERNLLRSDAPENAMITDRSFAFNPGFKSGFKEKILRFHTTLRTESEGAYANQYGIETRYPLADIRLIKLVYSLPNRLFRPKPYTRALFRNVCKGLLPEKVRLQPKFSGAMTLAFAEYWKKTSAEQLKDYKIVDPLGMYESLEVLEKREANADGDFNRVGRLTGLKKMDYLLVASFQIRDKR